MQSGRSSQHFRDICFLPDYTTLAASEKDEMAGSVVTVANSEFYNTKRPLHPHTFRKVEESVYTSSSVLASSVTIFS